MSEQKKVVLSIVIVHYDTPELTLGCVKSIFKNISNLPFEIIIIDNGSQLSIKNELKKQYPAIQFIELGKNTGFSVANNLGIFNSIGKHVLILNSDTEMSEQGIEKMLSYLESHPEVGAVGPQHRNPNNSFQLSCGKFPTFFSELTRKIFHYRLSINDPVIREYLENKYSDTTAVDWVSGSCLFIKREALEKVGLFDENFFMYFEDIDLCTRIRKAGWEIHYLSDINIVHYGGRSVRHNLLHALVEYRKSQAYFVREYYGFFGGLFIRLLLLFKYGFNFLKWSFISLVQFVFRENRTNSYTMLLLSKKVIEHCFVKISKKPEIPKLYKKKL